MFRNRSAWLVLTAMAVLLGSARPARAQGDIPGLRVREGILMKDDLPFRGVGVNYFDSFYRVLIDPADTSYIQGFAALKARGVQVVRFMAGGFWPIEWQLYRTDKPAYFARLDAFVHAAERADIGLVPSLFWYMACVPDIVGEPCNRWGDPDSAVIAFMRQYTHEVVTRYLHSPAIWAWEFGNEYNLSADLPNAAEWRPAIWADLGTALFRTAEDDLYHDDIVNAFHEFAVAVRDIDPVRPITTGNGLPRPAAQHMRSELSWTEDSREEFKQNLIDVTPAPMDLISIHVYPQGPEYRFNEGNVPLSTILSVCAEAAAPSGKALFIGEFGIRTDAEMGDAATTRAAFDDAMAAIEASNVGMTAAWIYGRNDPSEVWNITPTNGRAWMLDGLAAANTRIGPPPAPHVPITAAAWAVVAAALAATGYRALRRAPG